MVHLILNDRGQPLRIHQLLKLLMIQGCLVSIDAMGCQKHIAQTTIAAGADYMLALKGNQGDLHQRSVSQLTHIRISKHPLRSDP